MLRRLYLVFLISILFCKSEWPPKIDFDITSSVIANENDDYTIDISLVNMSLDTMIVKKMLLSRDYLKGVYIYDTEPKFLNTENMDLNKEHENVEFSYLGFDITLSEKTIEDMLYSNKEPAYNFNVEIAPKDTLYIKLIAIALYKGDYISDVDIVLEPKNFNYYKTISSNPDFFNKKLFEPMKLDNSVKNSGYFSISKPLRTIVK